MNSIQKFGNRFSFIFGEKYNRKLIYRLKTRLPGSIYNKREREWSMPITAKNAWSLKNWAEEEGFSIGYDVDQFKHPNGNSSPNIFIRGDMIVLDAVYQPDLYKAFKDIPGKQEYRDFHSFPTNQASLLLDIAEEFDLSFHKDLQSEARGCRQRVSMSRAVDATLNVPCPPGLAYLPYQIAGVACIHRMQGRTLIGDEPGLGKQHPHYTNVLTPIGWKQIGTIQVWDDVIGSNGRSTKVTGVFPQGVKSSYRITFSDHSSVEAGPEHLWTVHHRKGGKDWEELTLTTQELMDRPIIKRKWDNGRTTKLDLSKTDLYLPMLSEPVQFSEVEHPTISPYLLGQLIANGYLTGTGTTLTCNKSDWVEIQTQLWKDANPAILGAVNFYETTTRANFLGLVPAIKQLGLNVGSADKFIPRQYFMGTPYQRIKLLQGLMDGDGSISKERNKVTYHTISPQLAYDVQELIEGLGGIASVRDYDRSDEGKPKEFQVRIRLPKGIFPFTIERKRSRYNPGPYSHPCRTVTSVEYVCDVESVCISVDAPDRLYVTEHCILTHNTIQFLGWLNILIYKDHPFKSLIICPATLKDNWLKETLKWLTKELQVEVWSINRRVSKGETIIDPIPECDIAIVNYDILKKPMIKDAIKKMKPNVICVDESHYIKNMSTIRSRQVKALCHEADSVVLLNGTPIVNRPKEAWHQIHCIRPDEFPSFNSFARKFCNPEHNGFGWSYNGSSNLEELQQLLRTTVMIRREKNDVLTELPDKRRSTIFLPLNGSRREYDKVERELKDFLRHRRIQNEEIKEKIRGYKERRARIDAIVDQCEESEERNKIKALIAEERGNQARLTGFVLAEIEKAKQAAVRAKWKKVESWLDDFLESDEKVIIFTTHHWVTDKLIERYKEKVVKIDGRTPVKKRQGIVEQFQHDDEIKIFIGGLKAANTGITLTAASNVVFVELGWSPGDHTQAEDRAHRIGQKNAVNVWYLIAEDTIEEKIAGILDAKAGVCEVTHGDRSGDHMERGILDQIVEIY